MLYYGSSLYFIGPVSYILKAINRAWKERKSKKDGLGAIVLLSQKHDHEHIHGSVNLCGVVKSLLFHIANWGVGISIWFEIYEHRTLDIHLFEKICLSILMISFYSFKETIYTSQKFF